MAVWIQVRAFKVWLFDNMLFPLLVLWWYIPLWWSTDIVMTLWWYTDIVIMYGSWYIDSDSVMISWLHIVYMSWYIDSDSVMRSWFHIVYMSWYIDSDSVMISWLHIVYMHCDDAYFPVTQHACTTKSLNKRNLYRQACLCTVWPKQKCQKCQKCPRILVKETYLQGKGTY